MPPSVAPDARVDASTEGARSSSPGACSAPLERWLTVASTWSRARISAGILAVSVCGSVVIVSGMSALFHGVVLGEYLVTGILTASLVSLVVAVVVTRLIAMLQQAERRATEASLAKSHFLANMSHEIRTPLNAILGMAEIIRRAGVSPDQLERLGTLERAGEHLLHIVDAILDLAKIEAGRFTLRVGGVRVEAVLANVASMLHDRAAARKVRIVTHVDAGIGRVLGDATRLQQAVLNYAGNALRFTEDGVVTLRALRLDGDADAVRVRFEVEDTGVGIEPAALARLFAPFEQVNNTATRSHGGTGLGLAITRRLAEMMGGEAGATSAPGVGSTFWFTARLARAHAPSDAPEVASPPEGAEATLRRTCAGDACWWSKTSP